MEKPLITIITVSFNAVESIEKTILSVINQNYSNIEYIIIDGGSTDGTLDVIQKYDKSISIWISEPDNGIYDAMNKGIKISTGSWINFMNAGDEFYDNSVIKDIFCNLSNYDNYNVIYGNTICNFSWGSYIVTPSKIETISTAMPFCHQSTFTKTEILKQIPFDLKYRICADHNWFYNLYKITPSSFFYCDKIISIFDSISGISSTNNYYLNDELNELAGDNNIKNKLKLTLKRIIPSYMLKFIYRILYKFNRRFKEIK